MINKLQSTILATCLFSLGFAQQNQNDQQGYKIDFKSNVTDLPLSVTFEQTKHLSENQFSNWLKQDFLQNENVSIVPFKTEFDPLGYTHTKYYQYYKGYKMDGVVIITHHKNNEVISFNGDYFKNINIENTVSLSEQKALEFALKKVNAKKYKWENQTEEKQMQEALNNPAFTYKPVGDLIIYSKTNQDTKQVSHHYAYKFNIYAEQPLYRAYVYVDAQTGEILQEKNLICTVDAVGSANTKYSGTQQITTDNTGTYYRLRETARGSGIETYNMKNGSSYTAVSDFTNTVNTWTLTNNDQAATDAHFGAEKTYDFYYTTFNRNSIDNAGYKLLNYVHYSTNYVNAFWDGQRMTYGDGDVSQGFTIMTALDVCGHEITHGVVENTCQLNGGGSGEADALNEAFADIFGTSVEWFARPSQHDWIMGKDIMTNGQGIRDMSNPNNIQQPDTYKGTYWDNTGEPHTNNGPCIFWFYVLSVGKSGTNDNNQAYNVTGITMAKAQAIAYRAMTVYMTPSTTYADVRNYTIQAAKDLYGGCSNEVIQTTNAWYAVGVGTQYVTGAITPNFAADQTSSCVLPLSVNFSNTTAAGLTYKWTFGDGATSTQTNVAHTYTANGSYAVKLVATGCTSGKDSVIKSSYITINAPTVPSATGGSVCAGGSAQLSASGTGSVKWYNAASNGTLVGTGNNYTTPTLTSSTTYYAVNTVTNAPVYGGPANNTVFGGGSNFNGSTARYLIFDVLQPCTLKTVVVVANSAGNRVIELRDASGTVIQSSTINVAAGTQTLTLNFNLTPGSNYQLGTGGTLVDLYRNNTGSGYPYNIGGMVNITSADAGSSYYYYYYNWQVQKADCQSAPVAVTASVSLCPTGIVENNTSHALLVYPNPASEYVTLNVDKTSLNNVDKIEMFDMIGKSVRQISMHSETEQINLSDLSKGVYMIRVQFKSGEKSVVKFVKE